LVFISNFLTKWISPNDKLLLRQDQLFRELDVLKEIVDIEDLLSFRITLNLRIQKSVSLNHLDELIKKSLEDRSGVYELIQEVDLPADLKATIW